MDLNNNKVFKIFVDFDGTISQSDIGEEMFLKFGNPKKAYQIIDLWMAGDISSVETWIRLCETVENLNLDEYNEFIDSFEIDPNFKDFKDFCDKNSFDIYILSDGLDHYINRVLNKYNLKEIPVYSNELTFGKDNKLIPMFPYKDEECKQCANCKRNHIINNSSDEDFTIYIGDGYSDTCPAQYCDFIFAKDSLLKFCEKNRISYYPFRNFDEIIVRINDLYNKKRLKKRHQAYLKRKEVYIQG